MSKKSRNKSNRRSAPGAIERQSSPRMPTKPFATGPVYGILAAAGGLVGIVASYGDILDLIHNLGWALSSLISALLITFVFWRAITGGSLLLAIGLGVVTAIGIGVAIWYAPRATQTEEAITAQSAQIHNIAHISAPGGYLRDEDFSKRSIGGSDFHRATFINVDFHDADLSESDLRLTNFRKNVNFAGANLCAVDARGADLRGVLNFRSVVNFNFMLYDNETRFPDDAPDPSQLAGAIEATTHAKRTLLYSCRPGEVQLVELRPKPRPKDNG